MASKVYENKDELVKQICELIAVGKSVKAAGHEVGVPEATFFTWLLDNKAFAEEYTRVRQFRADARYESIDQVLVELKEGLLDSQTARVIIDTIKWQCGKEKGGVYGDSTQIKHANADGSKDAQFNVGVTFIEADKSTDSD